MSKAKYFDGIDMIATNKYVWCPQISQKIGSGRVAKKRAARKTCGPKTLTKNNYGFLRLLMLFFV